MAAPVSRLAAAAGGFRAAGLATMGPPGPALGEADLAAAAVPTELDDAPELGLSAHIRMHEHFLLNNTFAIYILNDSRELLWCSWNSKSS